MKHVMATKLLGDQRTEPQADASMSNRMVSGGITWRFLADCYSMRWRTQKRSVFVALLACWLCSQRPLALSPLPPPGNHWKGLRRDSTEGTNIYNLSYKQLEYSESISAVATEVKGKQVSDVPTCQR